MAPIRPTDSGGWGVLWRGRSLGTDRVELQADRVEDGRSGWRTLLAPQGIAEADEGQAGREREQPFVLRHHARCDGCQGAKSEEYGRPSGEDVGAKECDAEDEAASQVGDAGEQDRALHEPDLTVRGAICWPRRVRPSRWVCT